MDETIRIGDIVRAKGIRSPAMLSSSYGFRRMIAAMPNCCGSTAI